MKLRTRVTAVSAENETPPSRSRRSIAVAASTTSKRGPRGGVQKRRVNTRRSVAPEMPPPPSSAPATARRRSTRMRTAAPTPRRELRSRRAAEPEEQLDKDSTGEVTEEKVGYEEENSPKTIDDLPEEVMLGIFSYFRPPQLCWKIGRVCRQWASWSVSSVLWRNKEYVLSPDPNLASKQKV